MSVLKVPRTQAHLQPSAIKIRHQLNQPGLRFLLDHGSSFNGADGGLGFILRGFGERVDVIENIGGFGDTERFSASKVGCLRHGLCRDNANAIEKRALCTSSA